METEESVTGPESRAPPQRGPVEEEGRMGMRMRMPVRRTMMVGRISEFVAVDVWSDNDL